MNRRRLWLPLFAVPLLGALWLTFQRMDEGERPVLDENAGLPRYTLHDATLMRYDADGLPSLQVTAATVTYFDNESGHAETLHADLLNDGRSGWRLQAPSADLPAHQRRIHLNGAVHGDGHWPDSGEALSLDTAEVWVDPDQRQFSTDAAVTVRSATRQADGTGLRGDWQTQRLQLLHDVVMTYDSTPHH